MGRIETLIDKYKDIEFKPMYHCPKGFYAIRSVSKYRIIVFYNADLSEDSLYTSLLHELEHHKNGDCEYSEKNEYSAEVNSAIMYIDERQLRSYINQHPEANDFEIAENFDLTVVEFHKCIQAYRLKGVTFNNTSNLVEVADFFKTS